MLRFRSLASTLLIALAACSALLLGSRPAAAWGVESAERELATERQQMWATISEAQEKVAHLRRRLMLAEQGISRRRLGIRGQPVTARAARKLGLDSARGCLVIDTFPGGEARPAGIKVGDIILEIDANPVPGPADLGKILAKTRPDRRVYVEVWRRQEVEVMVLPALVDIHRAEMKKLSEKLARAEREARDIEAGARRRVARAEAQLERRRAESNKTAARPARVVNVDTGGPGRHRLGVRSSTVPRHIASSRGVSGGALVLSVQPNGPADVAGVQQDDIIVNLGGYAIETPEDLARRVGNAPPYLPLYIRVARGNSHDLLVAPAVAKEPTEEELKPSFLKAPFRKTRSFEHKFWNLDQFIQWLRHNGKQVRFAGRTAFDFFGAGDGGRLRFDGKRVECYVFEHSASFDNYDTKGWVGYYNVKCSDEGASLY